MGDPNYKPYPEFQSHEFDPPTYQPDYSSHYPSYPSHPYQTCPPDAGNYCLTWSDEGWKLQNTQFHQDQTCPDQNQCQPQPHPQQCFEPTTDGNHYANSTEGDSEGLTVSLQNMRICTRSNDKLVTEMQHTYEEQQSNVNDMIRQVALLTEMMKKIQENRARSEVNESRKKEKGVKEVEEEKEPAGAEQKSRVLLEETEAIEIESDEKEMLTEEESITTPPDDEALKEILEEAHDEPLEKEEKVIEGDVEVDNTLFYLQSEEVHMPYEKVEEFTTVVEEEDTPAEGPPPVIDKSEGCCYGDSEPEIKEERSRRKAARAIY